MVGTRKGSLGMFFKKLGISLVLGLVCSLGVSQTKYDFLFIHHSVGLSWLSYGNLYLSLTNPTLVGGRKIALHMATYGDTIGWNTDTCHWRKKFRDQMNLVLKFDRHPDKYYKIAERYNQIVMFKSCFNNSQIDSIGIPPGDPDSPKRTLFNYIAVMQELAMIFDDYPHILFIYVTSPPRNPYDKWSREGSALHRNFCKWLKNTWIPIYKKETGLSNFAVFDFFDVLAEPENHPTFPNALKQAYRNGKDSHPNTKGLTDATKAFLPWFNKVVSEWERTKHGGCSANGVPFPWLHSKGRSFIGNSNFAVTVERINPSKVLFLFVSGQMNSLNLGRGCYLKIYLTPLLYFLAPSTGSSVTQVLSIPALPELIGVNSYLQAIVFPKSSLNLDSLEMTNLLRVKILAR